MKQWSNLISSKRSSNPTNRPFMETSLFIWISPRAFKDDESRVHTISLFNTTDLVNLSVTFPLTKMTWLRYFSVAKVELVLNSLIKFDESIVMLGLVLE